MEKMKTKSTTTTTAHINIALQFTIASVMRRSFGTRWEKRRRRNKRAVRKTWITPIALTSWSVRFRSAISSRPIAVKSTSKTFHFQSEPFKN